MEIREAGTSLPLDGEPAESQTYLKQDMESPVDEEAKGHAVEQLTQKARQEANKIADEARRQVVTQLAHQKDRAATRISNVGAAIREAGKDPRQLGQTPIAPFTTQAAEQVEKVSAYLRRRDITTLQLEVERFARTRTPLFVIGALATGWIGARFLKSSVPADSQRPAAYTSTMPYSTPPHVTQEP
jgi:hypothetical protein